jgi:hypothetical protein
MPKVRLYDTFLGGLRQASSGLSSMRSIASWTEVAWEGRWSRLSSGFAGDAAAQGGWIGATGAFQSMLVLATVTRELEGTARRVPGGDGDGGG